jgi:murein DD-endopeptidase MepM/ murein hydrolase activator NlpD
MFAVNLASPVDYQVSLIGNFGKPHGGIDIKTDGITGKCIFSVGDGYVSRIPVGLSGFGNALYISHPEGYTSVYCHFCN